MLAIYLKLKLMPIVICVNILNFVIPIIPQKSRYIKSCLTLMTIVKF